MGRRRRLVSVSPPREQPVDQPVGDVDGLGGAGVPDGVVVGVPVGAGVVGAAPAATALSIAAFMLLT